MPSKTYKTRALVLRKTKLGEKDLIVTMLDGSGALVKGVAKGARKPGSSLAARLELFSTVDALMACGRSLDVVCEARLVAGQAPRYGVEQSACAAPVAELLSLVAQPGLEQPRLFDLGSATLDRIVSGQRPLDALALCTAGLWKVMGQSGFRPSLSACTLCGRGVAGGPGSHVAFSFADGGVVCGDCLRPPDAIMARSETVGWCDALIRSRLDEVVAFGMDGATAFDVLQLARMWVQTHTGRNLKSVDFLFTSGLF